MAAAKTAQQRRAVQNRRREAEYRNAYVQGTAVRKLETQFELEEPKEKQLSHAARKNRDKAVYMNFGYVLFLTAMMLVAGVVLISYLQVQSDITTSVKKIATLESQLNHLKMENDEELSRIETSIDLDEIRRIAINELGMSYAKQGQIVTIPNEGSDYVRQMTEIQK